MACIQRKYSLFLAGAATIFLRFVRVSALIHVVNPMRTSDRIFCARRQSARLFLDTPTDNIRNSLSSLQPNTAHYSLQKSNRCTNTSLHMYNLPPSGGGGGGNGLGDIVRGVLTIALIVAFFASPLGGLVLGLFNSFLVLLFVLPLVASAGFNIWRVLNTVSGVCPNCGSPAVVVKSNKEGIATPSLCFNCGAALQANYDNTRIDNVSGRTGLQDLNKTPMGGGYDIFDVFTSDRVTSTTTKTSTTKDAKEQRRGGTTIIDVVVEDDDDEKPFQ